MTNKFTHAILEDESGNKTEVYNPLGFFLRKSEYLRSYGFMKIFQGAFAYGIECKFSNSTWGVLWFIIQNIKEDSNTLCLNQKAIGKELGMSAPCVRTGVSQLLNADIIRLTGKEGVFLKVMLHPEVGFIGKECKKAALLERFLELPRQEC